MPYTTGMPTTNEPWPLKLERLIAENAQLREALRKVASPDTLVTQTRAGCRRVAREALNDARRRAV